MDTREITTRSRASRRTAPSARPASAGPLAAGNAFLAGMEWEAARGAFEEALELEESPEALEGLGMAAWWLDDEPAVFEARARAFRLYRARGDRRGAGRVAMTIAEDHLHFRGEIVGARGWHARARRLLEGLPRLPEHGWLRLWEGDLLVSTGGDAARAGMLAREAGAIGHELADVDLEMTALALEGLALVIEGAVEEGMPRLDEATTAAVSGEMRDPFAVGISCCYLVMACERVRDFERAAEWCSRVEELAVRTRFHALLGVCRAQYAEVLMWRGDWPAAESALQSAVGELAASRPAMQSEGLLRLAELHRLQGRLEEAGALLERLRGHPQAIAAQAALALEAEDAATAARLAERYLRAVPASAASERVRALDVLLRARLELGRREAAASALEELRAVAERIGTPPLRACALVAEARLCAAVGEHARARQGLEDAVDLYARCGARFEMAVARLELARALAGLGEAAAARAELATAQRSFEELGALLWARRAAALAAGGEAARTTGSGSRPAGAGMLTRRETEVLRLVAQGATNRLIAEQLMLSELTVKRHVANILFKLEVPTRAAAATYAARAGLL